MFNVKAAFSSFSVDDLPKAKDFYTATLGLTTDEDPMGLNVNLPNGGKLFIYAKDNHQPATFTVLNFVVDNIDEAVDSLAEKGVKFEHYDGEMKTDEKGVARGISEGKGPDIAWFKDPAGNFLSVLHSDK